MPKFKVKYVRSYTASESVVREIEAPSEAEAQALADEEAFDFNQDCPDDVMSEGEEEFDDWFVEALEEM